MEIRPLPADEDVIRQYLEKLWIPFNRELERIVDSFTLADDVNIISEETEFRLSRLKEDQYRTWIAIDSPPNASLGDGDDIVNDGELVGFITTEIDEPSPVFDRPVRLMINDIYVREHHRGTGLANDLIDSAVEWAREAGCAELALDVDVGNERARAFYEKLGFETCQRQMTVSMDKV